MNDRKRKLDNITDSIYYYMTEIIGCADDLEDIGFTREGEELRNVANQIENVGRLLLTHKYPKRKA